MSRTSFVFFPERGNFPERGAPPCGTRPNIHSGRDTTRRTGRKRHLPRAHGSTAQKRRQHEMAEPPPHDAVLHRLTDERLDLFQISLKNSGSNLQPDRSINVKIRAKYRLDGIFFQRMAVLFHTPDEFDKILGKIRRGLGLLHQSRQGFLQILKNGLFAGIIVKEQTVCNLVTDFMYVFNFDWHEVLRVIQYSPLQQYP